MEREKAETKERNCDYKLSIEKDRKESEEQRQKTNEMGKKKIEVDRKKKVRGINV